jgi:hypothetical protein
MQAASGPRSQAGLDLLDKFSERRYLVLIVAAGYFWLGGLWLLGFGAGDWGQFIHAVKTLNTTTPVGLYVGPVVIPMAWVFSHMSITTGWVVVSGLCMAAAVWAIRCLEVAATRFGVESGRRLNRTVLVGGLFALYAFSQPGVTAGHADDAIALVAMAIAIRGVASQNWLVASLAVAAAIDSKSWAGLMLPLACACVGARIRGLVVAGCSALVLWLPFLFIQRHSLAFDSLNLPVEVGSGAHYLGAMIGSMPGWPRIVQIAIALPLGAFAVARKRFYLVPLIALAVRVNLDPATTWYYQAGPVLGAFVWDVMRPMRLSGLRSALVCVVALLLPKDLGLLHLLHGSSPDALFAVFRLVVLALPIVALLRVRSATRAPRNLP